MRGQRTAVWSLYTGFYTISRMTKIHSSDTLEKLRGLGQQLDNLRQRVTDALRAFPETDDPDSERERISGLMQQERETEAEYEAFDSQFSVSANATDVHFELEPMVTPDVLRAKLAASRLPRLLVNHIDGLLNKQPLSHAVESMLHDPGACIERCERMFDRAAEVTSLTPDELIERTDLKATDLRPEALPSALAEVRAVNYLGNEDFDSITLLPASGSNASADIVAERRGIRYAVEARCAVEATSRPTERLTTWVTRTIKAKQRQVRATASTHQCHRMLVVMVVDTYPAVAFNGRDDFREMLIGACAYLGPDYGDHATIVTGQVTNGMQDDVVHPPWP